MNGKIFADSSSLCQDEAKILFDFYRQAAEKIVGEEERIEKEIRILEEERQVLDKIAAMAQYKELAPYLQKIYQCIMDESKNYEREYMKL